MLSLNKTLVFLQAREFYLYYSIRDICFSPGSDNKSYDHILHIKYTTQIFYTIVAQVNNV